MAINTRQNRILAAEDWKKIYQTFREADFASYDYETLRKAMIDYLKLNYFEDFNDYIESSEFVAIIDLIAFLGQSLALRADLNARENFIDTAERRESILKLARLISYSPKRHVCASGLLKISGISTTETVYDSDGSLLTNRTITWNDLNNENWYEQFLTVINSALIPQQTYGRPAHSQNINNIRTDEYNINFVLNRLPVFKFSKQVNGVSTDFEIISATSVGKSFLYEVKPDINQPFNILYRSDRNGNSSLNTGFFFMFKQGSLNSQDFEIPEMTSNRIVQININNINNNDVWLYKLNEFNRVDEIWEPVNSTLGQNVISNQIKNRNVYQINTLENDQISLVFGDGTFGKIPVGRFRIYYRIGLGLSYKITPDEMNQVDISVPYVSKSGRTETMSVKASLRYTVANAAARESIAEIKQRAPQNYYTQNRMITGEDYNIFPYTAYENIKKVKAINRISSGLSRYLDILDTTGKYSSTNIFGKDGAIYIEKTIEQFTISFTNRFDIQKFIHNKLIPDIIQNDDLMHVYYENLKYFLFDYYNDQSLLISESEFIDDELYEIAVTNDTDFRKYGAPDNRPGTFFYSKNTGNSEYRVTVSSVYNDLDTFYLTGDVKGRNSTIELRAGDIIHFDLNLYNDNFHIKVSRTNGTGENVEQGVVTNNGADTGVVSWNTKGVSAGIYYYTSRKYAGSCFDIDNFVNFYRKNHVFSVYKQRCLAIQPYYLTNNVYKISNDSTRYGFFKYPDHLSLAYWVDLSFRENLDPRSREFQTLFFSSADLIPGFTRHLTQNKLFDATSASGCGFADQPTDWNSTGMSGMIKITEFGTGSVRTKVKWHLSTNDLGLATGFFSYNNKPVAVGAGIAGQFSTVVPKTIIKFVPENGKYFSQALRIIPGTPGLDDSLEIFACVQTVYGDGTNNGQGNFSNGIGPITLNLPVPSGSIVETLVPAYKNELGQNLITDMLLLLLDTRDFALYYNSEKLQWQIITKNIADKWMVKFDHDSVRRRYVVSYKSLRYKFHSPKETNFYYNRDTLRYDQYYNRVNYDSVKILRSNTGPNNQPLLRDMEWYVKSDIKRDDGYVENKYIYLTYGDSNQDSIPDYPNLFDQIVLGAPTVSRYSGIPERQAAIKINYNFRNLMGRFPTVLELDAYVKQVMDNSGRIDQVVSVISTLQESIDYNRGIKTSKHLVFFKKTRDVYVNYVLLAKDTVLTAFDTFGKVIENFKNYEVGQIFYCRNDDQFYEILLDNRSGKKIMSQGLNNLQDARVMPEYLCYIGRQDLLYQYIHSADFTYRIDPNISNIIDLYVLTQEYDNSFRSYVADATGKIAEPVAPSNLDLAARYTDLDLYKSVSDTVVLHSAVYKKLFGSKADIQLQAVFRVIKNINYTISDAEIRTSVIAAVNDYFALENWDFGETFYFSEFAAYLHKQLTPKVASIAIVPKNFSYKYGALQQINSEPFEILISVATVDDVEIVENISSYELQMG